MLETYQISPEYFCQYKQWRIQDFPDVGAPTLQGAQTHDFAKFSQKLHEI